MEFFAFLLLLPAFTDMQKDALRKRNLYDRMAIIAAFFLADLDGDEHISRDEFRVGLPATLPATGQCSFTGLKEIFNT